MKETAENPPLDGEARDMQHGKAKKGWEDKAFQKASGGTRKKKGRGPGIGVKPGHDIHLEIHDNRIVTPQAADELTAIFKRSITGPWIRFSEYPASALQTVIARFKESGFT
ncbi:unnamed protein product [Linum tenue]|uniref:Uncharacterized protein n=1 Tax=Linum tenue TaxID=586396 RepID=A0AAV0INP9_9ROSI|nr:unnamed protein product [Linum tenue]